jgi:hypothetical protein
MAAEPYTLSAVVSLPPDEGQPAGNRDLVASGSFTHKQESKLNISGAGTTVVGFGTIPSTGAKVVLVDYPMTTPTDPPINLLVNGGVVGIPLSPGGGMVLSSPSPTGAGITALSIVATGAGTVKVTLLA